MDESDSIDSIDSNNETTNRSNGCNDSDNKLTQYMLINKELSKSLVVLRAENARLRSNNKQLSLESLTYRNELTKNRVEITKWRRKFTKLQAMHIQHVETLTTELQSYADKLTDVFGSDDDDDDNDADANGGESTKRVTEQHSPNVEECEDVSQRDSRSSRLSKPNVRLTEVPDENPSSLNTITEESETDIEISDTEQISLITSTNETTANDDTTQADETVVADETTAVDETTAADETSAVDETTVANGTTAADETTIESTTAETSYNGMKTIVARPSLSDSSAMASMDSNKENERPSTFISSRLSITNGFSPLANENNFSISHATESIVQTVKTSITPLKEKFITQRRTYKRKTTTVDEDDEEGSFYGFDDPKSPEIISSTPYKRKRSATYSNMERTATPVKVNDPGRLTRRSTMSISASGRPKRSVCPVSFVEPKLNTKMRRPR